MIQSTGLRRFCRGKWRVQILAPALLPLRCLGPSLDAAQNGSQKQVFILKVAFFFTGGTLGL